MNDKHIEDILRESWSPEPPEGMRDRILGNGRARCPRERGRLGHFVMTWKLALACLGIAIVLITNAVDHTTQLRLSGMTGQRSISGATVVAKSPCTLGNWRADINSLLVENVIGGCKGSKGDNVQ